MSDKKYQFVLPQETRDLSIIAATSGMTAVFQWWNVRNVPDARQCAVEVCDAMLESPTLTNDTSKYKAVFIPGFIVGYRLTAARLHTLSAPEQQQELRTVAAMDMTAALLHCFTSLASKMKEVGAQDIYDLIQIEGTNI